MNDILLDIRDLEVSYDTEDATFTPCATPIWKWKADKYSAS